MGARIAGGIVAIISAALLIWVVAITFGPASLVAPTVNVTAAKNATTGAGSETAGQSTPSPTPQQILAARTQLMQDRIGAGHDVVPPLSAGDFTINMDQRTPPQPKLAQQWEANKPSDELLQERGNGNIRGISSLPYKEAANFQQPGGRDWRRVRNDPVRYGGGWLLFGTIFALAFFLVARGRIKIADGYSGDTVLRFGALERTNHWMTASAFVLMGITGLIILYGEPILIPLIGEGAFGSVAWWSTWLHMAFAFPFVLGILIMIGVWLLDNFPTRLDWQWLKQGGGFLHDDGKNPPARKFNAGQKIVFWGVTLGGLLLLASGLSLMFPFFWFGYGGMQTAQVVHACLALLTIALILGHIYIGTIGMQGAIDAMWSGRVDRNWAKEHHSIWYERITGRRPESASAGQRAGATPAE
jgi:formate dehydrogenase subunit gamma